MQESAMQASSSDSNSSPADTASGPLVEVLSRAQRRVLGVLVEKAYTTPEYYPLTLKAITTGCNQKSNRSPVTNYSEDSVEETLDELRQLGLVAVIHTESGRTERYRHHMRQHFPFSEQQLAIITELLLRGRQQLGELRSRASRMVSIEGQDELREQLAALQKEGFIQASGPLGRRGIEVDHAFYPDQEGQRLEFSEGADDDQTPEPLPRTRPVEGDRPSTGVASQGHLDGRCDDLQRQLSEVHANLAGLQQEIADLKDSVARLERDLGV